MNSSLQVGESSKRGTATRRVLLIEDDPDFRAMIEPDFHQHGLELSVASSLGAARLLIENANEFDAVVVDLVLPDGNGLDLIARMREFPRRPPVIVISQYLPDYLNQMMSFYPEVKLIVAKPIESQYLAAIVDQLSRPAES
jgi:two-component system, OmpR family, phosphate regulon response regulator OmpR